ncbi:allophanate hydrolase subunit 1 [Nakamurella silvestris]|nr:allophanate hydrolase subunit 1 [Nakamurella silvestris]
MGESALLVEADRPLALHAALTASPAPGQVDIVPAERTVLVVLAEGTDLRQVRAHLESLRPADQQEIPGSLVEIGVDYTGEDLLPLAATLGMEVDTLIGRHAAAEWTVAFVGFAPGFGYLTSQDWDLEVPRLARPRTSVPAGAVALAGRYSGVYPRASPGGWQLLGTTARRMWDTTAEHPALLTPGTRVRFRDNRSADRGIG